MNTVDEHDDDLEPEVIEGAEIETENYLEDEDLEPSQPGRNMTNPAGRPDQEGQPPAVDIEEEEQEGDASDTI